MSRKPGERIACLWCEGAGEIEVTKRDAKGKIMEWFVVEPTLAKPADVREELAKQMLAVLLLVAPLVRDECEICIDGYTILHRNNPEYGRLSDEGKKEFAPWLAAYNAIESAIAKAQSREPLQFEYTARGIVAYEEDVREELAKNIASYFDAVLNAYDVADAILAKFPQIAKPEDT